VNPQNNLPQGYVSTNASESVGAGSKELVRFGAYPRPPVSYDERGQFLEYLQIARSHLLFILALALVGAGAGVLFSAMKSPVFRARTTLDIQAFNENILNMNRNASAESAPANSPGEAYIQTEIKLIQSESMTQRVIGKLKAQSETPATKNLNSALAAWTSNLGESRTPQGGNEMSSVRKEQGLAAIGRNLKVRTLGTTRIVEVLCDGYDPRLAADFCNTLANEYIAQNSDIRLQTTEETVEWLSHQLDSLRLKLSQSEQKLEESAKASGLVSLIDDHNVTQDQLRLLQGEVSEAKADRVKKQSLYEMASTGPDQAASGLADGPVREYQMRLTELQRQRAALLTTLTPEHFQVQELDSQIRLLESTIQKERASLLGQMGNDYHAALRREKLLTADYDSPISGISDLAAKAVQYSMAKREVDSRRQLYEAMLHRVEELGVASAMRASTIRVVDRATVPGRPFTPNWPGNCAGGAVAGCFFGFGFAFVRSRSDRSIKEPGDAVAWLNVRELGVIPAAPPSWLLEPRRLRSHFTFARPVQSGRSHAGSLPVRDLQVQEQLEFVTLYRKHAVISECFAATMNSILFAHWNDRSAHVLVFTSPEPGDGKSTIASNLAITLAQIGRKVLLIDGDLRLPRLSQVFGISKEPGLIGLLRSEGRVQSETISNFVHSTPIPNLFFLSAGDPDQFESKLLHSSRLRELIEILRKDFDDVLIDTPPMMQISDARVFGQLANGVLLVLRAGKTSLETALAAQRYLIEDGTKVLGTVLNDWNPRNSSKFRQYAREYRDSRSGFKHNVVRSGTAK
jgi:succinoglycan biosynthesis transport protein ExoP